MASMSYCMFENTLSEMHQILNAMEEVNDIEKLDLNEYEKAAFHNLFKQCEKYLEEYYRLT